MLDPFTEQYLYELEKLTAIVDVKESDPILATRFDFEFNNNYYLLNAELDEKGETLISVGPEQGRVVSNTPIVFT